MHRQKCSVCGASFESVRHDARMCSVTCRTRDHRRRQKAELEMLRKLTRHL